MLNPEIKAKRGDGKHRASKEAQDSRKFSCLPEAEGRWLWLLRPCLVAARGVYTVQAGRGWQPQPELMSDGSFRWTIYSIFSALLVWYLFPLILLSPFSFVLSWPEMNIEDMSLLTRLRRVARIEGVTVESQDCTQFCIPCLLVFLF